MRVILHVDMDAFYASVEQLDHPEYRGRPVVVGAPPDKRGVVSAASYEARRFGIHSAMPSREAGKLCPSAVFVRPRMRRYEQASRQIFGIFEKFTPLIEPLSLDEAFLDVTGARRMFGDGVQIAGKIRAAIHRETGLTASVGVAHNKFLAKIASDLNKPDGLTVVPSSPDGIRAFLAPLPVGRLWGVGKVTRAALEKAGIRTIGDIQRMSLDDLARRTGRNSAEFFKELADGRDEREVITEWEEKSISRENTFDEDTSDRELLEDTLVELVEDVGSQLRTAGKYAACATIKIRWKGFETITRQKKMNPPCADDSRLLATARELFNKERLIKPVRLIGFGVHDLRLDRSGQLSLFADTGEQPEKSERLSRTVDAIRSRFGPSSIHRARRLHGSALIVLSFLPTILLNCSV